MKKNSFLSPFISFLFLFSVSHHALSDTKVKNTLTVYTYDSFIAEWGPGPSIKKAFEAQCNCTLNLIPLEDGVSILNRLRLEGRNTQADVILGLDNNLMAEAEKTGLLSKHKTDLSALQLPVPWNNAFFVPFDYGYFSFIYDQTKLKNPPKSLKELIEGPEAISIIYQDPRTSTPGQGLMLWMKSVYGKEAPKAWEKMAKKTITVTKGWSEAYSMFLQGESDMVLSYTSSPAYHDAEQNKTNYKSAPFEEGHYLQIEVAAKIKKSSNEKLADAFMQFILTSAFQNEIPTGNWMYPVIKTPLPASFERLSVPTKSLQFTSENISENRRAWIREWQSALVK